MSRPYVNDTVVVRHATIAPFPYDRFVTEYRVCGRRFWIQPHQLLSAHLRFSIQQVEKAYTLVGQDGKAYQSRVKGTLGGHRKLKLYGSLRYLSTPNSIARRDSARHRVFFEKKRRCDCRRLPPLWQMYEARIRDLEGPAVVISIADVTTIGRPRFSCVATCARHVRPASWKVTRSRGPGTHSDTTSR